MRRFAFALLASLAGAFAAGASDIADIPPQLLARMEADTECRPFAELANGADIEIDRTFADGKPLFILPCWSAAYNFGWKVFVEVWEGEFELMAFPQYFPETGWTATTTLVNYWYDPATAELGSFSKARGLGDCGSSGTWAWRDYGFILRSFAHKGSCDAVDDDYEPGDFPLVYVAPDTPPADPGDSLPPVPLQSLPPDLLALHAERATDCDAPEDLPNGDQAYVAELGNGKTLYLVACTSGAYRFFHAAWLSDGRDYERLWFAGLNYSGGWQAEPGIWLGHFDPASLRLFASNPGTSMGNCGSTGIWRWNGNAFDMLEYRMQPDCGNVTSEPGRFPLVFAAELPN